MNRSWWEKIEVMVAQYATPVGSWAKGDHGSWVPQKKGLARAQNGQKKQEQTTTRRKAKKNKIPGNEHC